MSGERNPNNIEGQMKFPEPDSEVIIKPEAEQSVEAEFVPEQIPKFEKSDQEEIEVHQRLELFLHTKFKLLGNGNFVEHIDQLYRDREKHGSSAVPVKIEQEALFEVFIEKFPTFRERDQLRIALEREMRKLETERREAEKKYDMEDKAGVVYDGTFSNLTHRLERLENSYNYVLFEVEETLEERAKYFEQKKGEIMAEFEKQSHLLVIGRDTRDMTLEQATRIVFNEWRTLEAESYQKESYKKAKEDLLEYLYKYFKDSTDRKLLVLGLNDKAVESKTKLQSMEDSGADDYELSRADREYQEQNDFAHFVSIILNIKIS